MHHCNQLDLSKRTNMKNEQPALYTALLFFAVFTAYACFNLYLITNERRYNNPEYNLVSGFPQAEAVQDIPENWDASEVAQYLQFTTSEASAQDIQEATRHFQNRSTQNDTTASVLNFIQSGARR